jgi:hypothetical protein
VGTIHFNEAAFRAHFPAYATTTPQTSSPVLQAYWDTATAYVSDRSGGCYVGGLTVAQQTLALNLMTAHLVFLSLAVQSGNTPGILTGATIDKISVTLEPPPAANAWRYWLNQSPYGQQLLALFEVASAGGFYARSGVPGRAGFRFGIGW